MKRLLVLYLCLATFYSASAKTIRVGTGQVCTQIKQAISLSENGDSVLVEFGIYKEGNIIIDKSIFFGGEQYPVLDGDRKYEVLTIKADDVTVKGFRIQHSGYATLDDPGGIKVYECNNVQILNNHLYDNFFGIYIQYSHNCLIKNNVIQAFGKQEQQIGNGVHCWKSDSLQIIGNFIKGNRDGIYFEFVTHSVIWRNISVENIRYGLHFMFSNDDAYFTNLFSQNGAGVAVMFTKRVVMMNNTFTMNWGDASYGLLLKEISDCYLGGNTFERNTSAVFMDGTNRIKAERNKFTANGWGLKIQANCMDNVLLHNNFSGNTFDVSTNGNLTLNQFSENYWDKYEGYDLNRDNIGDVPYRPLSLFSVIVERYPAAMLLFRSIIIMLLDKSEKILPSLTPELFIDEKPLMHAMKL